MKKIIVLCRASSVLKAFFIISFLFWVNLSLSQVEVDTTQTNETDTAEAAPMLPEDQPDGTMADKYENDERNISELRIKYHINADGTFNSGNVNRVIFAARTGIEADIHKSIRLSTSPVFIYGEQGGVLNERELFSDLRTTFYYHHRLHYITFASADKSNLRKINFRHIGAGGLVYRLIDRPNAYLTISNVMIYEKTEYNINEKFVRELWRNSTRLQGEYKFNHNKITLTHLLYFQPSITQHNVRWNGGMTFKYLINRHISFRTILEDSYESFVVPGRKNNDFRWTFGFGIEGGK